MNTTYEFEQTAKEMQERADLLRKLVESGNATMAQAERLADLERQISRYDAIRYRSLTNAAT